MYDHISEVREHMKKILCEAPDLFLVSVEGEMVGTHEIAMKLFSPLLSDLTQDDSVSHVSIPASGSVLHHLISFLTKGSTFSASVDELKKVGEVMNVMSWHRDLFFIVKFLHVRTNMMMKDA